MSDESCFHEDFPVGRKLRWNLEIRIVFYFILSSTHLFWFLMLRRKRAVKRVRSRNLYNNLGGSKKLQAVILSIDVEASTLLGVGFLKGRKIVKLRESANTEMHTNVGTLLHKLLSPGAFENGDISLIQGLSLPLLTSMIEYFETSTVNKSTTRKWHTERFGRKPGDILTGPIYYVFTRSYSIRHIPGMNNEWCARITRNTHTYVSI